MPKAGHAERRRISREVRSERSGHPGRCLGTGLPSALRGLFQRGIPAILSCRNHFRYTIDELAAGNDPAWPALLAATDLLVAGPFVAARARPDPLRGSSNQQVIPIGTRLLPARRPDSLGTAEFTVERDGTITASGFPPETVLAALMPRHGRA